MSPPALRLWRATVYFVACAVVIGGIAAKWNSEYGFTRIPHFGVRATQPRLPELAGLPIALSPNVGYDGQYYAQLAVNPDITSPTVQAAMDAPRYRAQRILLPLAAHHLGTGDPWRTLNIYALLNVVCWVLLGWLLHRLTATLGARGLLIWTVCMLSLGVLESVHLALTDLPAALLIAFAVVCTQRDQVWRAALLIGLAGLVRETSLLGALVLAPLNWKDARAWTYRTGPLLLAVLPACLWALFLRTAVASHELPSGIRNFSPPAVAMVQHFVFCLQKLVSGEAHYRHFFGPLATVGFAYQSWSVAKTALTDPRQLWARVALPFAILFWFLGPSIWESYWAVARACLPLTLAYCALIPTDRFFIWRLILPNFCLVPAVQRFLISGLY